jgi:hypothetical protein
MIQLFILTPTPTFSAFYFLSIVHLTATTLIGTLFVGMRKHVRATLPRVLECRLDWAVPH